MSRKNACCDDESNMDKQQSAPDRGVDVCKVCGSRHYWVSVDPVVFGIAGGNLSGPTPGVMLNGGYAAQ